MAAISWATMQRLNQSMTVAVPLHPSTVLEVNEVNDAAAISVCMCFFMFVWADWKRQCFMMVLRMYLGILGLILHVQVVFHFQMCFIV